MLGDLSIIEQAPLRLKTTCSRYRVFPTSVIHYARAHSFGFRFFADAVWCCRILGRCCGEDQVWPRGSQYYSTSILTRGSFSKNDNNSSGVNLCHAISLCSPDSHHQTISKDNLICADNHTLCPRTYCAGHGHLPKPQSDTHLSAILQRLKDCADWSRHVSYQVPTHFDADLSYGAPWTCI